MERRCWRSLAQVNINCERKSQSHEGNCLTPLAISARDDEYVDSGARSLTNTMQDFIRGQRAKLDQLAPATTRFTLEVRAHSAAVSVFDFVCFGLDQNGKLADDRFMVFFNQKVAPDDAIQLSELSDKSALFAFDLDELPPEIARLVFTISIDGAGTMRDLNASELTLKANGQALMRYTFSGADFDQEGALMLGEIYRKDGVWRVWASGQGFAGDLSALLKHFGGEETGDAGGVAASPAPVSSPSLPSAPVSQPAISSVPVNAATPTVIPAAPLGIAPLGELQKTLDSAPVGATIQLPRGEYRGPIRIGRALTIEGEGAVIWAGNGPVVAVNSAGVTLRGVQIEVTGEENGVALQVEGVPPNLQNVGVRGRVVGMSRESGEWKLPIALDLGAFAPRARSSWRFEIAVPVDCQLKTSISGLQIQPARVEAGEREIEIVASGIGPDTFLAGQIEVEHAGIVRPIPLSGRTDVNAAVVQEKRI